MLDVSYFRIFVYYGVWIMIPDDRKAGFFMYRYRGCKKCDALILHAH